MECGGRGEGGGCQVTGRWLHRGETYSVPAGGSHHGPVQTSQYHINTWHCQYHYTNGKPIVMWHRCIILHSMYG